MTHGGWDDHRKLFETYKGARLKTFDQALSALLTDLHERGLMENTMVIALGEFGRTPKINKDVGRDHWPFAMSVLMAGAGSIRDVIAFPKTTTGKDLLFGSPSSISDDQLAEYHLTRRRCE